MQHITIYHNPNCSKSRQALAILQNQPIQLSIVEYLKTPPSLTQLITFTKSIALSELIRTEDKRFKELHLSLSHPQQIFDALQQEPSLMQRPIVCTEEKTIIARPPERVLELIS